MTQFTARRSVPLYLVIGALGGTIGGLVGVGGGIVMVPMYVALGGFRQHLASGTSLGVMIAISLAGAIPYLVRGQWDWPLAGWLAFGAAVGVQVGTRVMTKLSSHLLRGLFGLLLLGVGMRMVILG